jgi:hypothetical protein
MPFGRPTPSRPVGRPGVDHPQGILGVFCYYVSSSSIDYVVRLFLNMVCLTDSSPPVGSERGCYLSCSVSPSNFYIQFTGETNEWMNECINEWMNECINEWMNEGETMSFLFSHPFFLILQENSGIMNFRFFLLKENSMIRGTLNG